MSATACRPISPGESVADIKRVAKTIKAQQALALALHDTGMMEAMYVAGIVANGAQRSPQELQKWAEEGHPR
jgi:3-methyladenine DNA glycosylase AlkD